MVKVVPLGELAVGTKPEKNPPAARGWQGSAKEDWVTLWFFGKKSNSIWVPTEAMMLEGLKASFPPSPTVTLRTEEVAVTAGGACAWTTAAEMARPTKVDVNCIITIFVVVVGRN